jgi:predicted transcriptional regulator
MNPSRLSGLKCAVYLLDDVTKNESRDEIVKKFDGDEQLVDIWVSFIRHNHWIEQKESGQFVITEKGREWMKKLKVEGTKVS